jgi:hypothetical protein
MNTTYQARLVLERNVIEREIQETRNTVTVGRKNGIAGLTVVDNSLRSAHCQLSLESIEQLMSELSVARDYLVFHGN